MTGPEKGDLLIQVTTWAGLTVHLVAKRKCNRMSTTSSRE